MKRLGITICLLILGYAVFYDIRVGTLPLLHSYPKTKQVTATKKEDTYQTIEVKSGDTVLSIVEAISKKKPPSVETVVADFKKLNENESATKIRIGKSYKFPAYK